MATLELILIRHGETDWNREKVFRGWRDVRINKTGIAQADATAEALRDKVFEAVYTSPLKRSVVTARRIAKPHGVDLRYKTGFMDINYGTWEGLTASKVEASYPALYQKWLENPGKVKFPGGESTRKAWKRVNSALREVLWTHGTGTVVIVSHRVPLKLMTAYLLDRKLSSIGEVRHDPCAMSVFEVEHKRDHRMVVLNDSRHLSGLGPREQEDF
ncbi:MAG: histidine phosphatase family protein [Thermoplasmata archaeon]|jgi:broad specificity phosphatase PhoE|nr:histidine phosphatase family protein [Thermoplasmata archaeon]